MSNGSIFRPVYRCANCGTLIGDSATECPSCGGSFGQMKLVTDYRAWVHPERLVMLDAVVPNGRAVEGGMGGIGWMVCNHRISMGAQQFANPLTMKTIAKGMSVIAIEGYVTSMMIVHPFQMHEIMGMDSFVSISIGREMHGDGFIGHLLGLVVLITQLQPPGKVLMLDHRAYERVDNEHRASALAMLIRGRTSIG